MSGGNTIEARLRIALQGVSDAVGGLKSVQRELEATGQAAAGVGRQAAANTGTEEVVRQAGRRSAADLAAADAAKRALREKTEAERAAARESRRLADEERKRKAALAAEERRNLRDLETARQKAARNEAYKKAALAPQITDITVGLATGQSPVMVALQQGGQLRDLYGGILPAVRAVLSVLTATRLVVGGIAAGLGVVAYQIKQGYDESQRLRKELALTGNVANTSLGQINSVAVKVADEQRSAIGGVRNTVEALISTAGQTDTTLESTTRAVTALRKLTGQSAEEAVKQFADQAAGVTDWAVKANKAYNFLSASQVRHIRELESQGRTAEAVAFTNEELAKTLLQRTVPAIGLLEKAWNGVGNVLSGILDKFKAIGRDTTPEDKIAELQASVDKINQLRRSAAALGNKTSDPQTPAEAELEAAQRQRSMDLLRSTERAAAQRTENDRIYRESKAFQDSLASVEAAGIQKRLAQRRAALDKEQSTLDLAHERELVSESDYALQSNAIERQRLEAQAAALQRQLSIERGRTVEKPEDVNNRAAAVAQLEGQLVDMQSRLRQAASKADQLLAAEARESAATAAKAWQDAYEKIRGFRQQNAASAAGLVADPAERARLEAEAATRGQRDDLERSRRTLQLQADITIDPAAYRKLQAQVDQLTREGTQAIDETDRRARFDSLQRTLAQRVDAERQAEQAISDAQEQGALTAEEAEKRKFDARAKALPQLQLILQLMQALAKTDEEKNAVAALLLQIGQLQDTTTDFAKSLRGTARNELAQFFTDLETGAKSGKHALLDLVVSFGKALLNLINQKLAERLLKQLEGAGGGGGWLQTAGSWVGSLFHNGGVIGAGAGGMVRTVSPLLFAGAQILHGGGMVLAADERPVIARVGEEMLTEDDPRHVRNLRNLVGGVTVQASYTFNNAGGSDADQRAAAEDLQRQMDATVERWAAKHQRQGGILAGLRRG